MDYRQKYIKYKKKYGLLKNVIEDDPLVFVGENNIRTVRFNDMVTLYGQCNMVGGQGEFIKIKSVSCGKHHVIAIDDQGNAWSWGANHYKQLGRDKDKPFDEVPKKIPSTNHKFIRVECGYYHNIALLQNKETGAFSIRAWGNNQFGQLGTDSKETFRDDIALIKLPTINNRQISISTSESVKIKCGYSHSLVLIDNNVFASGRNRKGQLGTGDTTDRTVLTYIGDYVQALDIACGKAHSILIGTDGKILTCGIVVGVPRMESRTVFSPVPIDKGLTFDESILYISAGESHSVAIDNQYRIWAWGMDNKVFPTEVGNVGAVQKVVSGKYHSMVLKRNGRVYSWGSNNSGQLGIEDPERPPYTDRVKSAPELVSDPELIKETVIDIACGELFSVAIDTMGKLWSWGYNAYGVLARMGRYKPATNGHANKPGLGKYIGFVPGEEGEQEKEADEIGPPPLEEIGTSEGEQGQSQEWSLSVNARLDDHDAQLARINRMLSLYN